MPGPTVLGGLSLHLRITALLRSGVDLQDTLWGVLASRGALPAADRQVELAHKAVRERPAVQPARCGLRVAPCVTSTGRRTEARRCGDRRSPGRRGGLLGWISIAT